MSWEKLNGTKNCTKKYRLNERSQDRHVGGYRRDDEGIGGDMESRGGELDGRGRKGLCCNGRLLKGKVYRINPACTLLFSMIRRTKKSL